MVSPTCMRVVQARLTRCAPKSQLKRMHDLDVSIVVITVLTQICRPARNSQLPIFNLGVLKPLVGVLGRDVLLPTPTEVHMRVYIHTEAHMRNVERRCLFAALKS